MTTEHVLHTITDLQPGDHLCCLYQTEAEHRALLTPFLHQGLERGEKVLYIVDVHPTEAILDYLRDEGLEVEPYLASGQLRFTTTTDTYLRAEAFNPDDMVALLRTETQRALAEGYQALRVAGEMTWALQGLPGSDRLLEYESKLSTFFPGSKCLAICLYEWCRLDPGVLFNVLATHPTVAIGTEIYDNFYCLPPADLVQDGQPMAILRYWLGSLAERKQAEERLAYQAHLLANVHDAIIATNERLILTAWNKAAEELYGWKADEVLGEKLLEVIRSELTDTQRAEQLRVLAETGHNRLDLMQYRKDGQPIYVETNTIALYDANRSITGYVAVNRDITERKRAEAEIRRHAARMEALAEISQALAAVGLDVQAVLDTIVRHMAELIGDTCGIRLLSSDEQWFQSVAFHHPKPEVKMLMKPLHSTTSVSTSQEWLARVLWTGQSLLIPIVNQEQLRQSVQPEYLPFFEQVGLHSVLIVPLRIEGRVIGTLGLSRDQPGHPYTPDDQVLLQDLADRAALTLQNAQLFEQVHGAHERQQALSRRLLVVQEAERRHIARELHDEIGQVLTGLKLLLDMSTRLPAHMVKSRLGEAQALVNELLERVDELSLDLRPEMLDDLGLLPTLLWHFERYTHQTNIKVTFQQMGLEGQRFTPEIEMTIYRLIQEALTNVARHAEVGEVTVRLWVGLDTLGVEVEDRGTGFDPLTNGASTGLSGMRERVVLLDGQLTIEAAPGSGTYITAELPLPVPTERSNVHDDDHSGG